MHLPLSLSSLFRPALLAHPRPSSFSRPSFLLAASQRTRGACTRCTPWLFHRGAASHSRPADQTCQSTATGCGMDGRALSSAVGGPSPPATSEASRRSSVSRRTLSPQFGNYRAGRLLFAQTLCCWANWMDSPILQRVPPGAAANSYRRSGAWLLLRRGSLLSLRPLLDASTPWRRYFRVPRRVQAHVDPTSCSCAGNTYFTRTGTYLHVWYTPVTYPPRIAREWRG